MTVNKNQNYNVELIKFLGRDLDTIAKTLFKNLREIDKEKVDVIIVERVKTHGLGLAIMNRLKRAAVHNIIKARG